jgi:hypothetical protein
VNPSGHVIALALAIALQVPGTPRGDSQSALIVGQVVDAESGRPANGAVVSLTGPPAEAPHSRILTGDDGRFVYRNLRAGPYNIYANKAGYADGAYGRTRPAGPAASLVLMDGERIADIVIRMWRHAAISGTVVDEAGERLIGVRVQAYRRAMISGRRRFTPSGAATTDDRGIYRIGGLVPGDYIVGAVARPVVVPLSMVAELSNETSASRAAGIGADGASSPLLRVGDAAYLLGGGTPTPPPSDDGRLSIYPPTFHPNAPSGDAASVVTVRSGSEHLSADIQLQPVPTVSVSGFVHGPDGPVTATVLRLAPADTAEVALDADATSTLSDRAGRFTFPVVPPGHYRLELLRGGVPIQRGMSSSPLWAKVPISVGTEPIEDFGVEARPGVRIAGRVHFDGDLQSDPLRRGVTISIEGADSVASSLVTVRADPSGEFISPPLAGGRYYVRVPDSPPGWMFRDATAAGRDVVDTPLDVMTDVGDVVITFTDRWSGVRGFVQNRQGPDPSAAVLIFPVDAGMWGSSGRNPRRMRLIRPGKTGEYSVNLPPGEYYVIAVPDDQAADWQDPRFLDAAGRAAARITIADGERRTRDLRTQQIQ